LSVKRYLGLVLIVVSFLPWVAIAVLVPLLPLSIAQKAVLVPVLAVVAEVIFWLGLLLVGKEAARRYRRYLNLGYLWQQLKRLWRRVR
jgi:uncharacterized membrane protein